MRPAPEDQEEIDEAHGSPDDPLPLVQHGSEPLAQPDGRRRRPGEHRSQRCDQPIEQGRPADLPEDRGPDQVQVVRRGLVPGGRERAGDVVAQQGPDDEDEEPDERESDPRVAQGLAPGAAREPDRKPVEGEHEDEQPDTQDVDGPDAVLRERELVGLHQRDVAGGRRQLRERALREAELRPDLDDHLVHVERDDSVAGRDAVAGLVLEHVDELLVGDGARLDEELLHARPLQEPLHALRGRLLEGAGEDRAEPLEARRQPIRERLADVDVRVQLVDRVARERRLDLLVLDDLGRRLVPGRVVEHLPVHPGRQDRDERQDGRKDDERPDDDPALAAQRCSGFRGGYHGCSVRLACIGGIVSYG